MTLGGWGINIDSTVVQSRTEDNFWLLLVINLPWIDNFLAFVFCGFHFFPGVNRIGVLLDDRLS
jgi:hypothetical protein